jgi:hypothetical protein
MRRCKSQRARRQTRLLTFHVGVVFEERLYNRHSSCVRAHMDTNSGVIAPMAVVFKNFSVRWAQHLSPCTRADTTSGVRSK